MPRTTPPTKNTENAGGEGMDWEPTRTTRIAAAQQQRATWVSPEIMEERKRDGTCLRCGGEHFRRDCRLLPPIRPNPRTTSKPSSTAAAAAKVEDKLDEEEGNSDGSENV